MLKKITMSAAALLISAPLCAAINFDNPKGNNIKEEISNLKVNVPTPVPATMSGKSVKEWTVMVFVNGKNNLERFAMEDMNEMEKIGSSDQINVVTEIGRMSGYDSSDGNWVGARRYLVQKDGDTNKITSPVVADLGRVDMGDYEHLIDFGNWAKANYPAKKYMLVVWNHGSGWDKVGPPTGKGISYDDETNTHITTPQLGLALQGMGGVAVYGSDACLMQMPEVNYEIKDYVEYIVGSEETEPGDGYTYDLLLGPLVSNPYMSAEELGKLTVDAYSDFYQTGYQDTTQSLFKVAAMDDFLLLVNDFVGTAMYANEKALVKTAVSRAQSFATYNNKDLGNFLKLYAASSASWEVKSKAQALQDYLKNTLIVHNRLTGSFTPETAMGLSVYLPGYSFDSAYNGLAWARASQWDEFVNWYLSKDAKDMYAARAN